MAESLVLPTRPEDWTAAPDPLTEPQLERYLARLGVARPAAPTLAALAELQLAHLRAIPFENLDARLGRTVHLELEPLVDKLLSGERGGYCFEQNTLAAAALGALGYGVVPYAGRMLLGADGPRPRTHEALRVTPCDAPDHLVDVGFGRASLTAPLPLTFGTETELLGDRYRITEMAGEWAIETARGDGPWQALYLLDPRPAFPVDVEMANHYVSTHPNAYLSQNLILLRPVEGGRRAMINRRLLVDEPGRSVDREIEPSELDAVLRTEFGIVPPAPVGHVLA